MDLSRIIALSQDDATRALLEALDIHVAGEAGHGERVAVYSVAMGDVLRLDDVTLIDLKRAALLHDIGKIGIDPSVLGKLGQISEEEFALIKSHALLAEEMLSSMTWMENSLAMIRHHHERFDGLGYPSGLCGDAIPIGARIIGVAEAFDMMVTDCGWRDPISEEAAIAELRRCSGTQFDPEVVAALIQVQPLIQPLGRPD